MRKVSTGTSRRAGRCSGGGLQSEAPAASPTPPRAGKGRGRRGGGELNSVGTPSRHSGDGAGRGWRRAAAGAALRSVPLRAASPPPRRSPTAPRRSRGRRAPSPGRPRPRAPPRRPAEAAASPAGERGSPEGQDCAGMLRVPRHPPLKLKPWVPNTGEGHRCPCL